jgi:protein SCO1
VSARLARAVIVIAAVFAVAGCERPAFEMAPAPPSDAGPLMKVKPAPEFQLTERSGQPFSSADLKGRVWVADFFYTNCPGPCGALSARMSELQDAVKALDDVRLVSISSNPEQDTPEVLRGYAERYKAGPNWMFLTGGKDAIFDLANKGFLLSLTENEPGGAEPVTHATRLVLVDRAGIIRGYYDGLSGEGVAKIVADIGRLLEEKP